MVSTKSKHFHYDILLMNVDKPGENTQPPQVYPSHSDSIIDAIARPTTQGISLRCSKSKHIPIP